MGSLLIHGAFFYLIRERLKSVGVKVKSVTGTADMISQYKTYFEQAPTRGWSRSFLYISVLALVSTIIFAGMWVWGPHS